MIRTGRAAVLAAVALTSLATSLAAAGGGPAWADPPPGPQGADHWQDAPEIPGLPVTLPYDSTGADADGPEIVINDCDQLEPGAQENTVWWRFTPDVSGDLSFFRGVWDSRQAGIAELTPGGFVRADPVLYPGESPCDGLPQPVLAGHTYLIGVADREPLWGTPFPGSPGTLPIDGILPGRVSSIAATPGDGSATVTWQAPPDVEHSGITGYQVRIDHPDGTELRTLDLDADARSAEFSGLRNGGTYRVAVTAERGDVIGLPRIVNVVPAPAIGTPTAVSLTLDPSARTLNLTWGAASGRVTGYRVGFRSGPGAGRTFDLPASARGWTSAVLKPWRTYSVSVRALTEGADGDAVVLSRAFTVAQPSVPGGVRAADGRDAVQVVWKAPAHAGDGPVTGYRVHRYDASGTLVATTDVAGGARSLTVSGLPVGVPFTFDVAAVNASGVGDPSPRTKPAARVRPPTVKVTGLAASVDETENGALLSWDAAVGTTARPVTLYRLRWTDPATGRPREAEWNGTSLVVLGAPAGTTLQVSIAAANVAGTGPWTTSTLVVVDATPSTPSARP